MSQATNKYTSGRAKKSMRGPKQTEAEDRQEKNRAIKTAFKSGPIAKNQDPRWGSNKPGGEPNPATDKRA